MSTPTKDEDLFPTHKSSDEHGQMYTESLNSPTYEGTAGGADGSAVHPDPVEHERMMQEWKEELNKVEEEIVTLRQVLTAKVREAAELKRKMGITPFQEFKHDMQTGINQIKGSNTYQKTSAVVKTASEKTSSALTTIGSSVSRKIGDIRNSQTFRSMEERVGSTYASVKAKVAGSKSDEGLDGSVTPEMEAGQEAMPTSPSAGKLPEDKVPL